MIVDFPQKMRVRVTTGAPEPQVLKVRVTEDRHHAGDAWRELPVEPADPDEVARALRNWRESSD